MKRIVVASGNDTRRVPVLDVPVLPGAAVLFGHPGGVNFVAFAWDCGGDELVLADGGQTTTGDSRLFLTYALHPAIEPFVGEALHGPPGGTGSWLALDCQRRRFHVATPGEASDFLAEQNPLAHELPAEVLAPTLGAEDSGWIEVEVDQERVAEVMRVRREAGWPDSGRVLGLTVR